MGIKHKFYLFIRNNFILFNAILFFTIFVIIILMFFLMIFSIQKSEATFLDGSKFNTPKVNLIQSPIMKIDNEIKPIPMFDVKNKLKFKMFDLPEIKNLNDLFPNMIKVNPITFTPPKFTIPSSTHSPKFDLFTPKTGNIFDSKNIFGVKPIKTVEIGDDETCGCGTDTPICQNEIHVNSKHHAIPELHEFESNLLHHAGNPDISGSSSSSIASNEDDNFILVDDQNFSKDDTNINLRKFNKFLSDISNFKFKSGTSKRDVKSSLDKLNLVDKMEDETSAEKAKRINDSLQKLMQFVTIVGHVDTFLTKKARDTIRKLSVIVDDDDYDYRRNRRQY